MDQGYSTVYRNAEGYYEEKRSRFIARIFHAESEEEVNAFLSEIRKKDYDASHHCYAYALGKKLQTKKSSDDGEPQGTAGHPILAVIEGNELADTLIVVTRYFGGTLLGTGGLVRAYTKAAQDAVSNAVIAHKKPAVMLSIETDYSGIGKLKYLLAKEGLNPSDTEYGEKVSLLLPVPVERSQEMIRKINDLSGGRIRIETGDTVYFASVGTETVIFNH